MIDAAVLAFVAIPVALALALGWATFEAWRRFRRFIARVTPCRGVDADGRRCLDDSDVDRGC